MPHARTWYVSTTTTPRVLKKLIRSTGHFAISFSRIATPRHPPSACPSACSALAPTRASSGSVTPSARPRRASSGAARAAPSDGLAAPSLSLSWPGWLAGSPVGSARDASAAGSSWGSAYPLPSGPWVFAPPRGAARAIGPTCTRSCDRRAPDKRSVALADGAAAARLAASCTSTLEPAVPST